MDKVLYRKVYFRVLHKEEMAFGEERSCNFQFSEFWNFWLENLIERIGKKPKE